MVLDWMEAGLSVTHISIKNDAKKNYNDGIIVCIKDT